MDDLKNLANTVLDSVVGTFESAGVELPERRYIAAGETAHDCEQVTVSLQQLYLGPPGDAASAPMRCDSPRTAVFLIEVVRAVPAPGRASGRPSTEAMYDNGERQMVDAYTLMEAGANVNDVFGLGVMADVTPGEPGGGMQAITMTLIIAVP